MVQPAAQRSLARRALALILGLLALALMGLAIACDVVVSDLGGFSLFVGAAALAVTGAVIGVRDVARGREGRGLAIAGLVVSGLYFAWWILGVLVLLFKH